MGKRKHISWKTKYASALLALGHIPYKDAKQMTEDQIISLYHVDHNILYETEHEDRDRYWNLEPKLIKAHREKTKADAKIIAKSRRIRGEKWVRLTPLGLKLKEKLLRDSAGADNPIGRLTPNAGLRIGLGGQRQKADSASAAAIRPARTIRSRGFDKTLRKKMDGTVVKRTCIAKKKAEWTPERRAAAAEANRKRWADPAWKARVSKNISKARKAHDD